MVIQPCVRSYDVCLYTQALPLFQHYLQLCEAHFEPDGVEVAQAFAEIAEAYTHIGRYGYVLVNVCIYMFEFNSITPFIVGKATEVEFEHTYA